MVEFLGEFSAIEHLQAFLLGSARLLMIMNIAPFFAGTQITGQLRFVIMLALYFVLHPMIVGQLPPWRGLELISCVILGGLLIKEILLGLLLGLLAGMMFWTIQCAGFFIDNQRGAGMAQDTDAITGEQSSPTATFLFQSAVYVFFSTGAFFSFLGVIYGSYELWPVWEAIPGELLRRPTLSLFFAGKVGKLALDMMLLSGPIIVACLLTDISLGLINRFASQLNVYVLAMPVKSGLASFLLIFYFALLMNGTLSMFESFGTDLKQLHFILP
ncbi:MAG: type III secretion system export apparatus subunit SctT [Mailhella sp.]|nr:type III secretion system export apparatus subunit SctT [Mailhella sp.]